MQYLSKYTRLHSTTAVCKSNVRIKRTFFFKVEIETNKELLKSGPSAGPFCGPLTVPGPQFWHPRLTSLCSSPLGNQISPGLCETDRQTDRQTSRQTSRRADRQTDRQTDRRETPPHSFRQPGDVSASRPVCSVTLRGCSGTSGCILLTVRQAAPVPRGPRPREDDRHSALTAGKCLHHLIHLIIIIKKKKIFICLSSLFCRWRVAVNGWIPVISRRGEREGRGGEANLV